MSDKKRALFIDRDGVINKIMKYSYGYDTPMCEGDVSLIDGVGEVIGWANSAGIPVVLISNQSGLTKGLISQENFDAVNRKIDELLELRSAHLDSKFFCFHHLKSLIEEFRIDCDCRKPKPGLLLKAASELNLDLSQSIFLGDRGTDAIAGTLAGCQTIIYLHHDDLPEFLLATANTPSNHKVKHLREVKDILIDYFQK